MLKTGFSALLGALAPVHPGYLKEGASTPAITYTRISRLREHSHDNQAEALRHARYQFTTHATTQKAAEELADQVEDVLEAVDGDTVGTVTVSFVEITNNVDLGYSEATKTWQVAVDAIFHGEY